MHEGHRRRMYEKLKNGDSLFEHELLEILLFNAYPRINTNPIAHALLNKYGSIRGVLSADVQSLTSVEGVGESVALYLKCIGICTSQANGAKPAAKAAVLNNYSQFKAFAASRLRDKTEEVLELYCLDKSGKVCKIFTYTNNEKSKVELEDNVVAGVIATEKPFGLLVAHNHLSGNSEPSVNDDRFTMEVQVMCSLNGVCLYDHCIFAAEDNIYSYFLAGRIDKIKREYSFDRLVGSTLKK